MKTVALVLLPLAASLAASQPATVGVGALEAAYDAGRMTVERFDGGLILQAEQPWSRTSAFIEVTGTAPCSREAMRTALGERGDPDEHVGSRPLESGLTLHWATTWTGCRARTGRPVAACIRHDGVTTLVRGLDLGCRTPLSQHHLILALMTGARPSGTVAPTNGDP